MALTPRLELRQSQGLVMTPQLMQAIRLLQLSSLDLAAYVESELESNPLLERGMEREDGDADEVSAAAPVEDALGDMIQAGREDGAEAMADMRDADYANVFEADTPQVQVAASYDGDWSMVRGDRRAIDGDGDPLEATVAADETLHSHLLAELMIALADPTQRLIGGHLVDLVDEAGYLSEDVASIAGRLGVSEAEVEAVLKVLQSLDPPGIGARDLAECLAIQLRERDRFDPAMQALVANLDVLARREFAALRRLCGVDEEDLADMIAEIRSLDPKPGHAFGAEPVQPVMPDVFVLPRGDGGWKVELNTDTLPRVLVDQAYYATVSHGTRSETERAFLSDCLQKANWLVRSLDQRARTILKVASEIVRQQDAFLAQGVRYLRPLNLRTVAEAIEMHESTVSRVTANKYMATPRGIFELKYFFTTAIAATSGGDAHSAESVRHRIRELIDGELPEAVLSDDALVVLLRGEGIDIARRTVAKYRESMRLGSSVQRRREKMVRIPG